MSKAFIDYLEDLARREDRGALAALRRGLGQNPGTTASMYPLIVPRIPVNLETWQENIYFIVAALFAWHPLSTKTGNLGDHLREFSQSKGSHEAIERRFTTLLGCHSEDLSDQLRQIIGLLKSDDIKVNWHELILDLFEWNRHNRYVQRKWARSFWRTTSKAEEF